MRFQFPMNGNILSTLQCQRSYKLSIESHFFSWFKISHQNSRRAGNSTIITDTITIRSIHPALGMESRETKYPNIIYCIVWSFCVDWGGCVDLLDSLFPGKSSTFDGFMQKVSG